MQEHQYIQNPPTTQNNNSGELAKFLLGLFTGVATAAPVTALIVRHICNKNKQKELDIAVADAENRAMQALSEVYKEEITKQATSANNGHSEPNRGISDGVSQYNSTTYIPVELEGQKSAKKEEEVSKNDEAYLASLQSPTDDDGPDYDLENYNLNIDDEEATEESRRFDDSRVEYLEMVHRYKDTGGDIPPMTINRDQFYNEHFFEKSYVNWYEEDDVFEEDDTKIDDPYYTFGFVSGKDMFNPVLTENREDPNICHVRNMHLSTDFEITRMHGSYAKNVIDGEAYYNGEAGAQY